MTKADRAALLRRVEDESFSTRGSALRVLAELRQLHALLANSQVLRSEDSPLSGPQLMIGLYAAAGSFGLLLIGGWGALLSDPFSSVLGRPTGYGTFLSLALLAAGVSGWSFRRLSQLLVEEQDTWGRLPEPDPARTALALRALEMLPGVCREIALDVDLGSIERRSGQREGDWIQRQPLTALRLRAELPEGVRYELEVTLEQREQRKRGQGSQRSERTTHLRARLSGPPDSPLLARGAAAARAALILPQGLTPLAPAEPEEGAIELRATLALTTQQQPLDPAEGQGILTAGVVALIEALLPDRTPDLSGTPAASDPPLSPAGAAGAPDRSPALAKVAELVFASEGPRAQLAEELDALLALSTERAQAARANQEGSTLVIGVGAVALGFLAALFGSFGFFSDPWTGGLAYPPAYRTCFALALVCGLLAGWAWRRSARETRAYEAKWGDVPLLLPPRLRLARAALEELPAECQAVSLRVDAGPIERAAETREPTGPDEWLERQESRVLTLTAPLPGGRVYELGADYEQKVRWKRRPDGSSKCKSVKGQTRLRARLQLDAEPARLAAARNAAKTALALPPRAELLDPGQPHDDRLELRVRIEGVDWDESSLEEELAQAIADCASGLTRALLSAGSRD